LLGEFIELGLLALCSDLGEGFFDRVFLAAQLGDPFRD